jgi:hypothetical protein
LYVLLIASEFDNATFAESINQPNANLHRWISLRTCQVHIHLSILRDARERRKVCVRIWEAGVKPSAACILAGSPCVFVRLSHLHSPVE